MHNKYDKDDDQIYEYLKLFFILLAIKFNLY